MNDAPLDEFDLDLRFEVAGIQGSAEMDYDQQTYDECGGGQEGAGPGEAWGAEGDSNTCYSTCSDPECQGDGADTNYSTCSPCPTVDAHTCVGDCTNDCVEPNLPTDYTCPGTNGDCYTVNTVCQTCHSPCN